MTLADFFLAVNGAGVRLANVGGQLQLRGPANALTEEIRAGAAEHKAAILAVLPPAPEAGPGAGEAVRERAATVAEANGQITPEETTRQCQEWDRMVLEDGFRHDHDWRDWRLEWLLELAALHLRMEGWLDQDVLARLRPLAEARPTSKAEWTALSRQIVNTEQDLQRQGKLPSFPWPERGEL